MRERLQLSGYAWFERGAAHVCAIGRSIGLADTTARGYLDKIADAYVMRLLRRSMFATNRHPIDTVLFAGVAHGAGPADPGGAAPGNELGPVAEAGVRA